MKEEEWNKLNEAIKICHKCSISNSRKNVVIYRGSINAQLLFLGEAPGKSEDITGIPFAGRAGKILDNAIKQCSIPENSYIILNVIKCRPMDNIYKKSYEKNCLGYLYKEIDLISPKLIVTLGRHALAIFSDEKITEIVAKPFFSKKYMIFPMLHPASILHDPRKVKVWNESLAILMRYIREVNIQ